MKKETRTKEIITKQAYDVWVANDGTEFRNAEDCQKYDDGAVCAYKVLLNDVLVPIKGSFYYPRKEENANIFKDLIDDVFDNGRRECDYYTFKPKDDDDVKNFIAMLRVQNATVRGDGYEGLNPFTQLIELKAGRSYVVIYYADSEFYHIINPEKFSEKIKLILLNVIPQ